MKSPVWKSSLLSHEAIFLATLTFLAGGLIGETEQGIFGGGGPLYGPEDKVVVFNATTLKGHIYKSKRAWMVEFFSSWCGHCIHFAPKWKQFAIDLAGWQNVVGISGIDCADDNNVGICREYEIMGYPTIRFFPPNVLENETKVVDGKRVDKLYMGLATPRSENVGDMKKDLMDLLVVNLPFVLQLPKLTANVNEAELWSYIKQSTKPPFEEPTFVLVIFEKETSFIGKEVTLDLSRYTSVRTVVFHKKNALYETLGLSGWPAAGYFKTNSKGAILLGRNQNLLNFLKRTAIALANLDPDLPATPPPHEFIAGNAGAIPEEQEANNIEEPNTDDKGNVISMEDLIHAVRNSLRNEVGLYKTIAGGKLQTLKNYLHTLAEFFPADRRELMLFITKFSNWVLPFEQLDTTTFSDKWTELELEYHPWDISFNKWATCRGSQMGRRGYTCGLWTLFHTLTVVAYEKNQNFPVLDAIHGFVKDFFGCRECSDHFTQMVANDGALMITPIKDQVLWLWKAHNKVNLRIKGSITEDPAYPKVQYPTEKQCPTCYDKFGEFDEEKVLEFLIQVYSKPERTLPPTRIAADRLDSNMSQGGRKNSSVGLFSGSDYWIFCIVYISVAVLLVLGYVHFRVRRRIDFSIIFCRRSLQTGATSYTMRSRSPDRYSSSGWTNVHFSESVRFAY